MCLAQGPDAVTPVRLEPAAPRSRVKHSTTEPLRSQELSMKKFYNLGACPGQLHEDFHLLSNADSFCVLKFLTV